MLKIKYDNKEKYIIDILSEYINVNYIDFNKFYIDFLLLVSKFIQKNNYKLDFNNKNVNYEIFLIDIKLLFTFNLHNTTFYEELKIEDKIIKWILQYLIKDIII